MTSSLAATSAICRISSSVMKGPSLMPLPGRTTLATPIRRPHRVPERREVGEEAEERRDPERGGVGVLDGLRLRDHLGEDEEQHEVGEQAEHERPHPEVARTRTERGRAGRAGVNRASSSTTLRVRSGCSSIRARRAAPLRPSSSSVMARMRLIRRNAVSAMASTDRREEAGRRWPRSDQPVDCSHRSLASLELPESGQSSRSRRSIAVALVVLAWSKPRRWRTPCTTSSASSSASGWPWSTAWRSRHLRAHHDVADDRSAGRRPPRATPGPARPGRAAARLGATARRPWGRPARRSVRPHRGSARSGRSSTSRRRRASTSRRRSGRPAPRAPAGPGAPSAGRRPRPPPARRRRSPPVLTSDVVRCARRRRRSPARSGGGPRRAEPSSTNDRPGMPSSMSRTSEQPRPAAPLGQVDLGDVARHHDPRPEPEPGEEHLHLLAGRVLRLVEDDERVVEGVVGDQEVLGHVQRVGRRDLDAHGLGFALRLDDLMKRIGRPPPSRL